MYDTEIIPIEDSKHLDKPWALIIYREGPDDEDEVDRVIGPFPTEEQAKARALKLGEMYDVQEMIEP